MKGEVLKFDVMLHGRFVCTLEYALHSSIVSEQGLYNFVVGKLPSMKRQPFNIVFCDQKKGGKQ